MKHFLALLFFFFFTSCSLEQTLSKSKVMKNVPGKWEILQYGHFWVKAGYTPPSIFIFQEDGTYLWQYTIDGSYFSTEGRYLLSSKKDSPHTLFLEQRLLNGKALRKTYQGALSLFPENILTLYLNDPKLPTKEQNEKLLQRYRKIY